MPRRTVIWQLFLISLLSLFCEMLVIRWLATEVRVFAYFKNLPLMAAFVGLGLGFLWTDKKSDFMKWSHIALLYFSGLMIVAIGIQITHLTIGDNSKVMFFGDFAQGGVSVLKLIGNIGIMAGIFALVGSIFIGLGQKTGQLFEELSPLFAYTINILGALAGIVLFAIISSFSLGPGVWLIAAGVLYVAVERRIPPTILIVLGIAYQFYLAPYMGKLLYHEDYVTTVWSPYYRIDVRKAHMDSNGKSTQLGYDIFINYDSFQSMLDCRPETLAQFSEENQRKLLQFYEKSFRVKELKNPTVLVLGAGSGSDVAAALRCGAEHVDAVEIDRGIYELGKALNPEQPYQSPKVTAHIMDARTFLKQSHTKYDVILYAALDSHTAFSSLSSLRTDNYIFTVESLRDASKLLKPDGYIAVSFTCIPDWLFGRHSKDLYLATGIKPVGYYWVTGLPTGMFVSSPVEVSPSKLHFPFGRREVNVNNSVPEITDDWPFLFLPAHEIPTVYVLPILAVLLVCILPVLRLFMMGTSDTLNWQMFCLGMNFMLLEVRSISAMSLLCGSTWSVNSIVIGGVMVAILLGNLLASKVTSKSITTLIGLTIVAIIGSSFLDVSSLNALDFSAAIAIGTTVFLLPIFFAASCFSTLFKQTTASGRALAFNILGGVLGVTIEYASMIYGVRALAWFAVAICTGVLILDQIRMRKAAPSQTNA